MPTFSSSAWFRFALPLTWIAVTAGSIAHPGDEYGMLVIGGAAGFWSVYLLPHGNAIQSAYPGVIVTGAVTMFLCGWVCDRLRLSRRLFALVWLLLGGSLCAWALSSHPTLAKARSANGSIAAYVFFSMNLSLTLCSLFLPWIVRLCRGRGASGSP